MTGTCDLCGLEGVLLKELPSNARVNPEVPLYWCADEEACRRELEREEEEDDN
jgi:hypothetical protein